MNSLAFGVFISLLLTAILPSVLYADRVEEKKIQPSSVTIFCYHSFGPAGEKNSEYTVTPENFDRQMEMIRSRGFTVISLAQYMDYLEGKRSIPEKAAIITMDDGFKSVYTVAYPIVKKYGYPFTLFVYTDLISKSKHFLTWEELSDLAQNGVEIGSHSQTHPILTVQKATESDENYQKRIVKEVAGSKKLLEEHLNKSVRFFAYPYGAYDDLIMSEVQKAGYLAAVTVNPGPGAGGTNPFSINRRIIVQKTTDGEFLAELKTLPISFARNSLAPADGAILHSAPHAYEAAVVEDQAIDPQSYRVFVDSLGRVKSEYVPEERIIRFNSDKPLRSGLHIVTVIAKDKETGATRMGSWSFLLKKS